MTTTEKSVVFALSSSKTPSQDSAGVSPACSSRSIRHPQGVDAGRATCFKQQKERVEKTRAKAEREEREARD